jgi:hypothetical protein
MAVVSGKSDLIADLRLSKVVAPPSRARGRSICAAGSLTHAADDSNLSKWHLCDIPADAILDSRTAFKTDTMNCGANIAIGTKTDVDALYTGAKGAALQPIAFGDAKHGLPAWQVLGLAARPADNTIGIYMHALANATLAGSAKFEVHYRYD